MKIFLRVALGCLLILLVLSVVGYGIGRKWGSDLDELKASQANLSFEARRNAEGVWKIKVKDMPSLAYAFGYIHGHDREFQTQLLRRAASGKLSALFGSDLLKRDRMFRFSYRVSEAEWAEIKSQGGLLKEALEAYAHGRNQFVLETKSEEPIENKVFKIVRASEAPWTPIDVLAISRLQAWQFSSDHRDELLRNSLRNSLSDELAYLFSPSEPVKSQALYDQALINKRVKAPAGSGAYSKRMQLPSIYLPPAKTSAAPTDQVNRLIAHSSLQFPIDSADSSFIFGSVGSASNSWVIADPRVGRELTLCNDTHLDFSFPSALYPVAYELDDEKEQVRGTGYSLPGIPFVLLGRIERERKSDGKLRSLALGITIAESTDVQDLVELAANSIAQARLVTEEFEVRDLKSFKSTQESFIEAWTSYGPRVDDIINWGTALPRPVALDWIGFRRSKSSLNFFLRRNYLSGESLKQDLMSEWELPSANLSFIESGFDSKVQVGHFLTGMNFLAANPQARVEQRTFLSESSVANRRVSYPWERPYLETAYDAKEPLFFASANQRIFGGDMGLKMAFESADSQRSDRILERFDKNVLAPEFSQTDFYAGDLRVFLKAVRSEVFADPLCGTQTLELSSPCLELLAKLDQWSGVVDADRWEPTVINIWRNLLKAKLWPALKPATQKGIHRVKDEDQEKRDALLNAWLASNMSKRSFRAILLDKNIRARWETLSQKKFRNIAIESFGETLDLLLERFGPIVSTWTWGTVHKIEWQHPFGRIPGALGPMLRDATLREPPSVSGSNESPGTTVSKWRHDLPTQFPAVHGAVMRFCAELTPSGKMKMNWANVTGTSGNPFSPWAWKFADQSWFKNKLLSADP